MEGEDNQQSEENNISNEEEQNGETAETNDIPLVASPLSPSNEQETTDDSFDTFFEQVDNSLSTLEITSHQQQEPEKESEEEIMKRLMRDDNTNITMKFRFGAENDQVVRIFKYLDNFGNFVHSNTLRFEMKKIHPNPRTCGAGKTRVHNDFSRCVFNTIPNIHQVRKIVGLSIGIPDSVPIFSYHENDSEALKSIHSCSYLFQNFSISSDVSYPPFLQFEFLGSPDSTHNLDLFPNRHTGIRSQYSPKKVYYYEVRIHRGVYAIGVAPDGYDATGVGWSSKSLGIHGDNGRIYGLYHDYITKKMEVSLDDEFEKTGNQFHYSFGDGSVIGVGFDVEKQTYFFTKNGRMHPDAGQVVMSDEESLKKGNDNNSEEVQREKMYPTIGSFLSLSIDEQIVFELNIGENTIKNPFIYDRFNMKEDSHLVRDKKERFEFLVDNYVNFDVRVFQKDLGCFKCFLAFL